MIIKYLKAIRKVFFWVVTLVVSILVILLLLLQTTFFQNQLAELAIKKFNEQTRHQLKLTNLKIKWFDSIEFFGVELSDYKGRPMVYISDLSVDYELNRLLLDGNLFFDKVNVQKGSLLLAKYEDTLGINLAEFIYDINQLLKKPSDTVRKPRELKVAQVRLDQFTLVYNNHLKDSLSSEKFDYGHFRLDVPVAFFEDFWLKGDTIAADIQTFVAKDYASGLAVEHLKSDFMICNTMLRMADLHLETSHSVVKDFLELQYSGLEDLGHFTDSVQFKVDLKESVISKTDLSYFANIGLPDFSLDFTGSISGSVPRLSIKNFQLAMGDETHLYGDIDFMGLPKLNETFIDATIDEGVIYPDDLEPFLHSFKDNLRQVGTVGFRGRFLGFTNDFVANADFQMGEGFISSDLNLKFPDKWEDASYSGKLELRDFNVGTYMGDKVNIQKVNLQGEIDGTGLTLEKANFFLNADFKNSSFFGYEFDEIQTTGEFASEFFEGTIRIEDPNSRIHSSGSVNLKTFPERINVDAQVDYLNLKNLGLVKQNLELITHVSADISGLRVDSLQGVVNMGELQVIWKGDSLAIDSIRIASSKNADRRDIEVKLPELDLKLVGDFDFSRVVRDFRIIGGEILEYFEPEFSVETGLAMGDIDFDTYAIDFEVNYQNINKYLDLFVAHALYISPTGKVEGTYYQRQNATLSLYSAIDSINYRGIGYTNNTIDLNLSKDMDSLGIIASVFINSQNQTWRHIQPTQDLAFEGVWYDNKINLNLSIEQPTNNSYADLQAELKLAPDRLVFSFLPSNIIAFGDRWFFNPYNKVEVTQQSISVERLELYQNAQSILLKGTYSDSLKTDLTLDFSDFNLANLNAVLPVDIDGIFNSDILLFRERLENHFKLSGGLRADELYINGFPVGDVSGKSTWDDVKKGLFIDLNVERESVQTIAIEGYYFPQDTANQLDVLADFNDANLVLLNPLARGLASDITGYANGRLDLTGTLEHPILNGEAEISDGKFTFDILGTIYTLDGNVDFDNTAINFNGIRLRDRDGDLALLNGAMRHRGFKNFYADLNIAASNFMFLNTTASDNSLYYGTANATGDVSVRGPINDLYIKASATTNKGTRIYFPLSGEEDIAQKDYISFVSFSDTTSQLDLNEIVQQNIAGVTLDFEIDVTPDAYVEMIFDIRTGDIIRGRGQGNLSLTLNTSGEFELFGDITVAEGAYNFTIPNLINKEFSIVPGSTISWYGDPMAGILNLEATYRQLASFSDFQGDEEGETVKHSILVVLDLTGDMLSPNIDFEIRYDNSQGTLPTNEQLLLSRINNDEQELKRQVFSLLILRKFTQEADFRMAGAPVQGSLSEFLSNQFSYYISQVDENLEIDFDLASLDQDAFNTFQLRLSYTFFDGRLRVTGGGAFAQNAPEGTTPTGDFVGDWSVRYLLTPDGHLRVKAFSQSEQFAGDWQRESGVSFQYLKSFDDLKELLSKTREEAIRTKPKDMSKQREANRKASES